MTEFCEKQHSERPQCTEFHIHYLILVNSV